jgi:hypothetical protein
LQRSLDPSEIRAALAFAHFLIWRYITRYGEWNGTSETAEESQQDAIDASRYAASLRAYDATIREDT